MNLIFQVGGPDQLFTNPIGLRFSFCLVGDLCQVSSGQLWWQIINCGSSQWPHHWEYDVKSYRDATTKEAVCKKTRRVPLVSNSEEIEDFEDRCMRARSSSVFLCPGKIKKGKRSKMLKNLNRKMSNQFFTHFSPNIITHESNVWACAFWFEHFSP